MLKRFSSYFVRFNRRSPPIEEFKMMRVVLDYVKLPGESDLYYPIKISV